MENFWSGLFTNLVAAAVVATVTLLKKRGSAWAPAIAYGLACGVMTTVIVAGAPVVWSILMTKETTPQNVESRVRQWSDDLSLGTKKTPNADAHWSVIVVLPGGTPVQIERTKANEGQVDFSSSLKLGDEHAKVYALLSPKQAGRVEDQLVLELARLKVAFTLTRPLHVVVRRAVSISSLTKQTFTATLDEIEIGKTVARQSIVLALDAN